MNLSEFQDESLNAPSVWINVKALSSEPTLPLAIIDIPAPLTFGCVSSSE